MRREANDLDRALWRKVEGRISPQRQDSQNPGDTHACSVSSFLRQRCRTGLTIYQEGHM